MLPTNENISLLSWILQLYSKLENANLQFSSASKLNETLESMGSCCCWNFCILLFRYSQDKLRGAAIILTIPPSPTLMAYIKRPFECVLGEIGA